MLLILPRILPSPPTLLTDMPIPLFLPEAYSFFKMQRKGHFILKVDVPQLDPLSLPRVCMCVGMLSHLSHVQLFATLWTIVRQAPLSMGFSRQQ